MRVLCNISLWCRYIGLRTSFGVSQTGAWRFLRLYQQMYPEDGATIPVEVSASYVHYAAESEILLKSCTHIHTHNTHPVLHLTDVEG